MRPSPTVVAHEFNLRYWGKSITAHTARSWIIGRSIPMQNKLRVLADWLQVSPEELRFGLSQGQYRVEEADQHIASLNMQDREMMRHYLALTHEERKTVRDVVQALFVAAGVKRRP
ncbi:MAG: hypothetical protein ACT4NV_19625 [Rhodoferax sp.]